MTDVCGKITLGTLVLERLGSVLLCKVSLHVFLAVSDKVALCAFEGTLLPVQHFMTHNRILLDRTIITVRTLEGFFGRMPSEMSDQVASVVSCVVTEVTAVRLFARVSHLVDFQAAFVGSGKVTLRTFEAFLS